MPTGVREAGVARSREALLAAAAAAFVELGVQAPVRDVAARAGVGVGTVYRHFPTRADLVVAVYRHQVADAVALAERLRADGTPPPRALERWVAAFVDFLVTKHGLGDALRSTDPALAGLHALLEADLVPACAGLLAAAQREDQGLDRLDPGLTAVVLLRAVGNLCLLGPGYGRAEAAAMVTRLLAGCRPGAARPR